MQLTFQRLFLPALLLVMLAGCATSPTGRHQLKLFDEQKMAAMGNQSYAKLKDKTPIDNNAANKRFVQCIARAIIAVPGVSSGAHADRWDITVFDSKQINAFALPGGNIGVYSGMLNLVENADQLATVLGHEVGHVLASHANERMSEQFATQGGLSVLSAFLGGSAATGNSRAIMSALGVGAQVGILLPFSRAQESEADRIGLELMAQAGFDPRAAIKLWENMAAAANGPEPSPFLSTHPSNQKRINALRAHMDTAMQMYRQAARHPSCPKP